MPRYIEDALLVGRTLSTLGRAAFEGIRGFADHHNIHIEGLPDDPEAEVPPDEALRIMRDFLAIHFPRLVPAQGPETSQS
ncbi:hypothetical protein [Streptomyces sp. NPDC059072]|uniref:hypothetical protein n=1 Tax=Streptomyces sp. NPDC059072 TaxID=3346715 RepID=UPI00368FCFF2